MLGTKIVLLMLLLVSAVIISLLVLLLLAVIGKEINNSELAQFYNYAVHLRSSHITKR